MPFGQTSGPPASTKQIAYLKSLLRAEGHDDFRTARHVYGLTQRQAAGKFTGREASELIDRLTGAAADAPPPEPAEPAKPRADLDDTRRVLLRGIPAELLADELVRRGWATTPPSDDAK